MGSNMCGGLYDLNDLLKLLTGAYNKLQTAAKMMHDLDTLDGRLPLLSRYSIHQPVADPEKTKRPCGPHC